MSNKEKSLGRLQSTIKRNYLYIIINNLFISYKNNFSIYLLEEISYTFMSYKLFMSISSFRRNNDCKKLCYENDRLFDYYVIYSRLKMMNFYIDYNW